LVEKPGDHGVQQRATNPFSTMVRGDCHVQDLAVTTVQEDGRALLHDGQAVSDRGTRVFCNEDDALIAFDYALREFSPIDVALR